MTGSGKVGGSSSDFEILVAKRVAGGDVPQPDQGGDVAGKGGFDIDALVGLDHHDAADALAFAGARIVNHVALSELAAVNAEENQLADIGIGPQLEGERAELGVVVGRDLDLVFRIAGFNADGGRHVERGGQIIDDGVHEGLDAAFLEGGTAQHGNQLDFAGQAADGRLQDRRGDRLVLDDERRRSSSSLLETASINSASAAWAGFFEVGGNLRDFVFEAGVVGGS